MTDLSSVIVAKSDQLNADDLLAGSKTITITEVRMVGGEQPVIIHYEGDDGKPYKPCKSMVRVMVKAWGADGKKFVGRSMTLFCDPKVKWGGMAVGGIRVSAMSHIDKPFTMSLTATRGKKMPYKVEKLENGVVPAPTPSLAEELAVKFSRVESMDALKELLESLPPAIQKQMEQAKNDAKARLEASA